MITDCKENLLRIDVTVQKVFLYWFVFNSIGVVLSLLFYWTSLDFIGILVYISVVLLFLFLPILGVFNIVTNIFYYKYGSYSEKIKGLRIVYNIATLIFLILLGMYIIAHKLFDYVIIDGIIILLAIGGVFALAHSYITLVENEIRQELKCYY